MYELNQVGNSTCYINSPTNIGLFKANGNDVWLIDSGNSKDAAKKALKHINVNGWVLKAVINTHSHADHIGGNKLLQERTGCNVYVPDEDCAFTNYPGLEPAFLCGAFPYNDLNVKFLKAEKSSALPLTDEILPDGLEVKRLDGHSYAQAAVKTCDGIWFLGDALVSENTIEKYRISYLYDVESYLNSLDTVKKLEGRLFIPSHAEPTEDIVPLADANIKNTLSIAGEILDICAHPITSEDIVKSVFDRYGLAINHIQHVLVGCTVRSFISYLYNKGALACDFCENKLYFKRA